MEGDKEEDDEDIRKVLGEDKTSPDEIRTFVTSSDGCDKVGAQVLISLRPDNFTYQGKFILLKNFFPS